MINHKLIDLVEKNISSISVLNCSSKFENTTDLIEIINLGNFSNSDIYLGVIYFLKTSKSDYILVDGKKRIISLSLLFYVLAKRINLLNVDKHTLSILNLFSKIKFNLYGYEKTVYEKLTTNAPLSYHDKQTALYKILEDYKDSINKMDVNELTSFCLLIDRIKFDVVYLKNSDPKAVFCFLNKDNRKLNQLILIKSYLAPLKYVKLIDDIFALLFNNEDTLNLFLKSYLSPKFNNINIDTNSIYDYFVKYFELIRTYKSLDDIYKIMVNSAMIYRKMFNIEFVDTDIRNIFISIASNNGCDTYSYLLDLCEDYENNRLSKQIFMQVCQIINTYTEQRKNNQLLNNEHFSFAKMIEELNEVVLNDTSQESINDADLQ